MGHEVRREPKVTDKPSCGLPKDAKMKRMAGMGPEGPGPGQYPVSSTLDQRGVPIAVKLPRPIQQTPGPFGTAGANAGSTDLATRSAAPSWGTLVNRTSVRKPPWREEPQEQCFTLPTGEKLLPSSVPIQFTPSGPKYSFMPKRPENYARTESEAMVL